jgi:hypothetical protein
MQVREVNAEFKRTILLASYEALEREGFTRFRKEDVDRPINEGFHCWVGLNTGLYPDHVAISPFVGVHAPPMMKLAAQLEAEKYNRGYATYAVHMGEIAPNENAFHFTRSTDIAAEAKRLARLYASVGLSYAQSIADYSTLLPLLEERAPRLGGYPQRVACCLYLMGRIDDAQRYASTLLPNRYLASFAASFLEMIESSRFH